MIKSRIDQIQTVLRKGMFRGLHAVGHRSGRVIRDLHYGREPEQKLDIYLPPDHRRGVQLVFFHGGSWSSGHKDEYAFLGSALAAFGISCAVVGYRLFPLVRYPAFVEDAAHAVAWLQQNGDRYGFDAGPLYLMGHSAGAHIACLLALDERYRRIAQLDDKAIRGVIALSGVYRFRPENSPLHSAIFESAAPDFEVVKPINYVGASQVPLLLLHGSNDTTVKYHTAQRMYEAAVAAGQKVSLHAQPGYGHVRPLFDFLPFMPNHQKTMALLLAFMAGQAT